MKKVTFNLQLNEIKVFEKEKIDYYDEYLSIVMNYLYEDKDKDPNENLKKQDMVLRNGKVKKVN